MQDAPLKIKLAVCPSVCQEKILLQGKLKIQRIVTHFKVYDFLTFVCLKAAEKDQESASPVRKLYCADENIERRNHYLDLAGIENYASKFDNMGNNKIIIIKIYFFFFFKAPQDLNLSQEYIFFSLISLGGFFIKTHDTKLILPHLSRDTRTNTICSSAPQSGRKEALHLL